MEKDLNKVSNLHLEDKEENFVEKVYSNKSDRILLLSSFYIVLFVVPFIFAPDFIRIEWVIGIFLLVGVFTFTSIAMQFIGFKSKSLLNRAESQVKIQMLLQTYLIYAVVLFLMCILSVG